MNLRSHFIKTISNERGSWVATAIALIAVSTGVSAYGSYQQGQAQKKMYQYQADVAAQQAEIDKKVAEQNITTVQAEAATKTKQLRRDVAVLEGAQKGMLAAQGVGGGSVTAADIAASTFDTAELDRKAIRYNADYKSWALKTGSEYAGWDLLNQRNQYLMAGKQAAKAGSIGMTSSILQGASQIATVGLLKAK